MARPTMLLLALVGVYVGTSLAEELAPEDMQQTLNDVMELGRPEAFVEMVTSELAAPPAHGQKPYWSAQALFALEEMVTSGSPFGSHIGILRNMFSEADVLKHADKMAPEIMKKARRGLHTGDEWVENALERAMKENPKRFAADHKIIQTHKRDLERRHTDAVQKLSAARKEASSKSAQAVNLEQLDLVEDVHQMQHKSDLAQDLEKDNLMEELEAEVEELRRQLELHPTALLHRATASTRDMERGWFWDDIVHAVTHVVQAVEVVAVKVVKVVKKAAAAVVHVVHEVVDAAKEALKVMGEALNKAWNYVKKKLKEALDYIKKKIVEVVKKVEAEVKEVEHMAEAGINALKDAIKDAEDSIKAFAKWAAAKAKALASKGVKKVKHFLEKIWDYLTKTSARQQIKNLIPNLWFTSGGVSASVAGAGLTRLADVTSLAMGTFWGVSIAPGDLLAGVSAGVSVGMGWAGSNSGTGVANSGCGYGDSWGMSGNILEEFGIVDPQLDVGVTLSLGAAGNFTILADYFKEKFGTAKDFATKGFSLKDVPDLPVEQAADLIVKLGETMKPSTPSMSLSFDVSVAITEDIAPGSLNLGSYSYSGYVPYSGTCYSSHMDFLWALWSDAALQPFAMKILISALMWIWAPDNPDEFVTNKGKTCVLESGYNTSKTEAEIIAEIATTGTVSFDGIGPFTVGEKVSFLTIGLALMKKLGITSSTAADTAGDMSLEAEKSRKAFKHHHGVAWEEMETWSADRFATHVRKQAAKLERSDPRIDFAKFMHTTYGHEKELPKEVLCAEIIHEVAPENEGRYASECDLKAFRKYSKERSKRWAGKPLGSSSPSDLLSLEKADAEYVEGFGHLLTFAFKDAESQTAALDGFGWMSAVMQSLHNTVGFQGGFIFSGEKTLDMGILVVYDSEVSLRHDANGPRLQDLIQHSHLRDDDDYGHEDLKAGHIYNTYGNVKIKKNDAASSLQDAEHSASPANNFFAAKTVGKVVMASFDSTDTMSEKEASIRMSEKAASIASAMEGGIATVVFENPHLDKALILSVGADGQDVPADPSPSNYGAKKWIVQNANVITLTEKRGLAHGQGDRQETATNQETYEPESSCNNDSESEALLCNDEDHPHNDENGNIPLHDDTSKGFRDKVSGGVLKHDLKAWKDVKSGQPPPPGSML